MNKNAKRGRPLPDVPDLPKCLLLHAFFVGLDHLFDHLAADGARLAGGEVAVIALLEVDAKLARDFIFHVVQRALGRGTLMRLPPLVLFAIRCFTSNRFSPIVARDKSRYSDNNRLSCHGKDKNDHFFAKRVDSGGGSC